MSERTKNSVSVPLLAPEMTDGISAALALAREWARRRLAMTLRTQPVPGTRLEGEPAVKMLTEVRRNLIAACEPVCAPYSSVHWLWLLRRVDFALIRGYLPNTELSIMRIAENVSGMSSRPAELDPPYSDEPLIFALDLSAFARIARLLAAAELINHSEGWLRRASKNAKFVMVEGDFPDLVEDAQLEAAIDRFDVRVVAAANHRWHPSLVRFAASSIEPLLLSVHMFVGGIGQTLMWSGRIADNPKLLVGEGRFEIAMSSLSDQSNQSQLRGALASMRDPNVAASLIVLSQALMWHATWYADNIGMSIPRVGYVLMRRSDLVRPIDDVLRLANEHTWPAMEGFTPTDAATVLSTIEAFEEGGLSGAPGPILRSWKDGVVQIDAFALEVGLNHRLRVSSSTGGAQVNVLATDFELAVQALVDAAGLTPTQLVAALRGRTLRIDGKGVTDIDALMAVGDTLICISCKKFELDRPYDSGDYVSVRNARTKVEAAVIEWNDRLLELRTRPVGDNYDISQYNRIVGVVVTPELAFVMSPAALAEVKITKAVSIPIYVSYGELSNAISTLTAL